MPDTTGRARSAFHPAAGVGERGGATSVQMALLWGVMTALLFTVVQTALLFYAGQLAATAAQEGVRAGRTAAPAGVLAAARGQARDFLDRAAGTALADTVITAAVDEATGSVQVQVTGTPLSLVPGVSLTVSRDAAGALERITP